MADWDDENFEPTGFDDKSSTDKWEGEDEEDDSIKDNWDDDDDGEEKKKDAGDEAPKATTAKKKRTLKEVLKEKEAKKIEEQKIKAEMKKKMEEEEEAEPLTQEELMAEKLRQQKLVEDSDLLLAMETFGITSKEEVSESNSLDSMNPSTREEFTEYSKLLVEKLSKFESNVVYVQFLEDTLRDLCASLEADDIKRLSSCLNLLHSEKLKAQKGKTKGKTKPKKAGLTGGKAIKKDDMDYEFGNEFDDFM